MGQPFLGELKIVSFNFAPKGWAMCNGQQLPINQNQALFSLLGTSFGGNGVQTFALPDLRGQVPMHMGKSVIGQFAGEPFHTVAVPEMPQHTHVLQASTDSGTSLVPSSSFVLGKRAAEIYHAATNLVSMHAGTVTNVGGSQPHENRQPFLALTFCIALQGIFPSRN